jgi:serine beta-lactamase-like protein LACTB
MKKALSFILLMLSFWAVSAQTTIRTNRVISQQYKKAVSSAVHFWDSLRRKQDIPGLSVAVGSAKQILWAEGFGLSDVEGNVPVNPKSRFRIGSVSKCLTSMAVGILAQEHKIDLDAPIQQYLPLFPQKKYPITSRQLAGHLAGIRHYTNADTLPPTKHYPNLTTGLKIFQNDSLIFQPGTSYAYSSYGFNLLGAVVEAAGHQEFLSYMAQHIFLPLGMNQTIADYPDSIVSDRVRFYEHDQGHLVNAQMIDNSYKWPSGGFLSTPTDLVKLGQGLMNHTILDDKTTTTMLTPQQWGDGKSAGVGIGWRIGKDSKGRRFVHHGGSIDGGRTFILIYPDDDLAIAITANMSGVSINLKEAERTAAYFFEQRNEKALR